MRFADPDLDTQAAGWRAAPDPEVRARGDNIAFEENIGAPRLADFEALSAGKALATAFAEYFDLSVQGVSRRHLPSTFAPANAEAHMPGGLDPNQVILRVERIDDALLAAGLDFAKLAAAFGTSAGEAVIRPVLDGFNRWRNARPAFAAFESEVADDLAGPGDTWVGRLVSRLGLAHHLPPAGDRWHFGLMRYRVQDVMDAAPHLSQRFAVPTVLESRMNEWFFPAPRHRGAGYAVDTEPALARPLVREILHARIAYEVGHLHRIGSLSGTAARPDLVLLRNTHLSRVRMVAGRPGYADMMRP